MSEEQEIQDGERVARLLADPAVERAITRLTESYVEKWKRSTSATERETLHAKTTALDDICTELRSVVDTGKVARITAERRNPTQQRPRR